MAMASTSSSLQAHGFQPKIVFIRKSNQGFGFTLRHFIAYPPETWNTSESCIVRAMETVFIKEVHLNSPAHLAGLQTGDRLLTVNDEPIAGIPYSVVVQRIKQTPFLLKLEVVSKECDVLQMYYTDIAHNPESNRYRDANNTRALLNYVPSNSSSSNNNSSSRKTLSFPTTNLIHNPMAKFSTNCHAELRKNLKINDKFTMGASNFNFSTMPGTGAINSNSGCDFMARLRKSIEQKEEFLKAVAPQSYPNSFFKTFKSSDNPKRMITGDKINNFYALNSMGFSENPKGEDDDKNVTLAGSGSIAAASAMTIKDVHYDEHNLYGGSSNNGSGINGSASNSSGIIKKDMKVNKTIEKYKPVVSPITLGIPSSEPISLIRIPSVFEKSVQQNKDQQQQYERKLELKPSTMNMQNRNLIKERAIEEIEDTTEQRKENDFDYMKSDCLTSLQKSSQILRRYKQSTLNDDGKLVRRISYLRATNNEDGFHTTEVLNPELINFEMKLKPSDKENECENLNELQKKKSLKSDDNDIPIIGDMEIKSSSIFGKRLTEYRSWRHIKIELKGDILKIITGRNINKSDTNVIELNLKNYEISEDITSRRKYVFKLQSTIATTNAQKNVTDDLIQTKSDGSSSSVGSIQFTEIYFKAENSNEMKKWLELIKSRMIKRDLESTMVVTTTRIETEQGKQLAEPQKTAAISSVSTSEYPDESSSGNDLKSSPSVMGTSEGKQQQQQQDIETESSSNSVCSPVIKTRKSDKTDKELGSPKSKNWRDLLFRKGGSGSGSGGSNSGSGSGHLSATSSRTGSIGFPLKSCPMSKDNEYLPYIVDICTKIVESKGLNVVGIYRIPGNKAAISELKDQVNRSDFIWDKINEDVRWEDVNVVSSLLKLFIRSLPDALLPSTFYNNFIEADKCTGEQKLKEIKCLLDQLPVHSYETLKHIIRHLNRISKNCDVNLMEPKNLAIIFGPSIIRTPNETLEIAVKDMKHQCCIVELLVSQYEYFFESGAFPQLQDNQSSIIDSLTQQQHQDQQTNLLLGNVQKIERKYNDKESVAARFIPHLRRRSQSKRSTINSDTYSGESILSLECKKSNNGQTENNSEHGSKEEGGSLEISMSLTDEESSNSRISDSGSMSLTTITDTLDSKLRNLRSTSESQSDENDSPNKQQHKIDLLRRNNLISTQQQQQPFVLHENIPFADESPERPPPSSALIDINALPNNMKNVFGRTTAGTTTTSSSSNNNNNSTNNGNNNNISRDNIFNKTHSNGSKKLTSSLHYRSSGCSGSVGLSCSDDDADADNDDDDDDDDADSEVSTTSDPKESILISPVYMERYKKRKSGTGAYNKLFRSASFNCRNYSTNNKFGNNTGAGTGTGTGLAMATSTATATGTGTTTISNLTKDEKTDINYTKKRQIQNKQNRSIKRRHTVGGPSDYSATITRRTDNNDHHHILQVGIRIKNVDTRRS